MSKGPYCQVDYLAKRAEISFELNPRTLKLFISLLRGQVGTVKHFKQKKGISKATKHMQ